MAYDLQRIKDSVVYESVANTHHTKDQWEQLAKEFFKAQLGQNVAAKPKSFPKPTQMVAESKKFSADEGFHEVAESEETVPTPKLYFAEITQAPSNVQPMPKATLIATESRKVQQQQLKDVMLDPDELAFVNFLKSRPNLVEKFHIQLPTDLQQKLTENSSPIATVTPQSKWSQRPSGTTAVSRPSNSPSTPQQFKLSSNTGGLVSQQSQVTNICRTVSPGTESFDSGELQRPGRSLSSNSSVDSSPLHSGCDQLCRQHRKILEEIQLQLDREAEWKQLQTTFQPSSSDSDNQLKRAKSVGNIQESVGEKPLTPGRSTHNLSHIDRLTPINSSRMDQPSVSNRNTFKDFLHNYKQAIKPLSNPLSEANLPVANRRRVEYVPIMTRITKEMEELQLREEELRTRRRISDLHV